MHPSQNNPSSIVTLNIRHGGGKRVGPLVDYLSGTGADVLVITEFRTGKSGRALTDGLADSGFGHQHWSVGQDGKNSVMIASQIPFEPVEFHLPEDHAHRLVGARFGSLQVWAVYMALGKDKLPLYRFLKDVEPRATILIGDFNTGLHRLDEQGATFTAADEFADLQTRGWVDAWRRRHGQEAREFTWLSPAGNGFRLDHVFVSNDMIEQVADCRYDHSTRPTLTDHSALNVRIT